MSYLRQLLNYLFNKPVAAFIDWYEYTEALEKASEPIRRARKARRAQRAIQREIYR